MITSHEPYAFHLLQHINGYFDAYSCLIKENLAYSNVELISSPANHQLNEYVGGNELAKLRKPYSVTHKHITRGFPRAHNWSAPLVASIVDCYDGIDSPFFPAYKNMLLTQVQSLVNLWLPQVLNVSIYLKARFEISRPTHIFTGNNQHLASRAACVLGKKFRVPSYDFLILANTNHPRYRPPIADIAYVYDDWYRDIYENYFGYDAKNIRVSGPLFDYTQRLSRQSTTTDFSKEKRHIVFFSQSGNFHINRKILEDICNTIAGREDVFISLKLHPHESSAHIERYKNIAKDAGVSENIQIWHRDADAIDLVNQADLVIQSYSNIGLDSFLLGKPVITVKYAGKPHARIFLYEKGIGKEVKTRPSLRKAIVSLLDDPKAKAAMKKQAKKFAKENGHFLRPDNAKRVLKEIVAETQANGSAGDDVKEGGV